MGDGKITHIGQYWSPSHGEVRILAVSDFQTQSNGRLQGPAFDVSDLIPLPRARLRFRQTFHDEPWDRVRWTYERLPFPSTELFEWLDSSGRSLADWANDGVAAGDGVARALRLEELDRAPDPAADHLVAPVIPRRALAFGVTYLNSALERETEGRRRDYGFVYKAVKERGERPEIFLKGSAPEHFVGPNGRMALRSDLTNSRTLDGSTCERRVVGCGIEPELALVTSSRGEIWGYTLANDVSGNVIENETLLYLTQAKYFTGCLVLGPLILVSREQSNPQLDITSRILDAAGETLFEHSTNSSRINAPLHSLVAWAASHIQLTPGEVFSTGTDVVPDGRVKVLDEGMRVEIRSPALGCLAHGAAPLHGAGSPNLDYSRREFEAAKNGA